MSAYPNIHSAEQHRCRGLVRRITVGSLPLIVALGFASGLMTTVLQEVQVRSVASAIADLTLDHAWFDC